MEDLSANNEEIQENINFSGHTLDKATKAKLTLENYYNNLISQHRERRDRLKRLEESLNDKGLSETVSRILLLL